MRSTFALACTSIALAAAAACATAGDEADTSPANDAGSSPLADTGTDGRPSSEADAGDAAVPVDARCSAAGWCTTLLPDRDLTLKDIWPFEQRAFAIAESPTLGVKVLGWESASDEWRYIDDNTQNDYGAGQYAGKIWAPSENEVYYAVARARIYRGTRPTPSSPWTWQYDVLESHSPDEDPTRDPGLARYAYKRDLPPVDAAALGVWGTCEGDVYAWYGNTVFRRRSEGGAPAWVPDYVAEDGENPTDAFYILGAAGSTSGDLWFAGSRGQFDTEGGLFACPLVVHRTAEGHRHIVDNVVNQAADPNNRWAGICSANPGSLGFSVSIQIPGYGTFTRPWPNGGMLSSIASVGPNRAVGLMGRNQGDIFTYVSTDDAGIASANVVNVSVPRADVQTYLNSVWVLGTTAWFSGWGLVIKSEDGPEKWSRGFGLAKPDDNTPAAGSYEISTLALNGAAFDRPFYQVRGISNSNLWAIGAGYALHKTTP